MNPRRLLDVLAVLLVQALPAQQLLWQTPPGPPSTTEYLRMMPFSDYDRDGYVDFLQLVTPNAFTNGLLASQIVSGRDASVLWSRSPWIGRDTYAGDVDGDGSPDFISVAGGGAYRWVEIWSPRSNSILWMQIGSNSSQYGNVVLGDLDVNADGRSDILIATSHSSASDVYVHDSSGVLLYIVPCLSQGRQVMSMCSMGDMNGDGRDDFLMGCNESTGRGVLVLVSGIDGSILRLSYGFVWGDFMFEHASNLGDIDGDGVNDYMGFPFIFSYTGLVVQFSGATGNVIRFWYDYADSVIAGQDMDLDGVPDLVIGSGGQVAPSVYGLVRALSGRDGTELWRVENFMPPPGSGVSNGSDYARFAAGFGVQPGSVYPSIAWMDLDWFVSGTVMGGTAHGRVRAYNTARAGQGPVTGSPCSSTDQFSPQVGARETTSGARITIAKAQPGALGVLNLALAPQTNYAGLPLPINLAPLGMTGCKALVGPEAHELRILGTTGIDRGYAAVDFPFHLTASALGTSLVAQWLVFDPVMLGYGATAKHEVRVQ